MLLSRLYLQLGTYLDYYTGEHNPSLSSVLLAAHSQEGESEEVLSELVQGKHRFLFPQFAVNASWPPTFLAHGSNDSAVLVEESRNMHKQLQQFGVRSVLNVIEGAEHSLDYVPEAEKVYGTPGGLFDQIRDFLVQSLQPLPN